MEKAKTENMGEVVATQQKNHGFSSHSPGTWNQDALISSTEKGTKASVPPKINSVEKKVG